MTQEMDWSWGCGLSGDITPEDSKQFWNPDDVIDPAVREICKNPTWREYLENAPPRAQELIRLMFWQNSLEEDDSYDEDERQRLDGYCLQMMAESGSRMMSNDWKYMYEYARKNCWIGQGVHDYWKNYERALAREKDFQLPECVAVLEAFMRADARGFDADGFERETVEICRAINEKKKTGEYSEATVENFYALHQECANRLEGGGGCLSLPREQ